MSFLPARLGGEQADSPAISGLSLTHFASALHAWKEASAAPEYVRLIMFATLSLCFFPSRARRRGKDSAPNERCPIGDAAVKGAKGALMLAVVVGSQGTVKRDAVIHVCDIRGGCGLFAWVWCMLVWFDEMSTTRAAGSPTGIG
jgi:hypothetical protein